MKAIILMMVLHSPAQQGNTLPSVEWFDDSTTCLTYLAIHTKRMLEGDEHAWVTVENPPEGLSPPVIVVKSPRFAAWCQESKWLGAEFLKQLETAPKLPGGI